MARSACHTIWRARSFPRSFRVVAVHLTSAVCLRSMGFHTMPAAWTDWPSCRGIGLPRGGSKSSVGRARDSAREEHDYVPSPVVLTHTGTAKQVTQLSDPNTPLVGSGCVAVSTALPVDGATSVNTEGRGGRIGPCVHSMLQPPHIILRPPERSFVTNDLLTNVQVPLRASRLHRAPDFQ